MAGTSWALRCNGVTGATSAKVDLLPDMRSPLPHSRSGNNRVQFLL
jgi:hypothetical protein